MLVFRTKVQILLALRYLYVQLKSISNFTIARPHSVCIHILFLKECAYSLSAVFVYLSRDVGLHVSFVFDLKTHKVEIYMQFLMNYCLGTGDCVQVDHVLVSLADDGSSL